MALDANYSRRAGLWSALFVAASPALLNQRTDYLIDLTAAMMTAGWWALLARPPAALDLVHLSGIGLGLVTLTGPRGCSALVLLLLLLIGVRKAHHGQWRPLAQGVISGLIAWLLIWPWFSQNWLTILSTINKAASGGLPIKTA